MKFAITGGTGFVGRHLTRLLCAEGHEVVLIAWGVDVRDEAIRGLSRVSFFKSDLSNEKELLRAFQGCDAVAHCAGINRELGQQTYQRVHIDGTKNVVLAARKSGVRKIALLSFLRARPNCGSAYHESKWQAEEMIRSSGLEYTVIKAGMIYGKGDHMLDHLSHALHTLPMFATVGFKEKPVRPLMVEDLVIILKAALTEDRLSGKTIPVTGPEELLLSEAARRVAKIIGKSIVIVPAPVWLHYLLAWGFERTMRIPLIAIAQVRILSEGVVSSFESPDSLPDDLKPQLSFTEEQIKKGLPQPEAFHLSDFRCCKQS